MPRYETDADREAERAIISAIERTWNCQARKRDPYSAADFDLLRDGKLVAVVETKRRNNRHDHYPDFTISHQKIKNLITMAQGYKVPAFLVVAFDDVILWTTPDSFSSVREGGRKDRNDWRDIEQLAVFELHTFKRIKTS